MGRIGGPLGKSLGGAREALGGALAQPFAARRSLLSVREAVRVAPERPPRSTGTAARCGKNAAVSPRSLPLAPRAKVDPPTFAKVDPLRPRRRREGLREGCRRPPQSLWKLLYI